MASSSSRTTNSRNLKDALDPMVEASSSTTSASRMQVVSNALLAPFTAREDSTRILRDLAPIIMTPRMINTAASSRNARGNPSLSSRPSASASSLSILGRAPLRFGMTRRITSRDLQVVEETPALLNADVPEPHGVANDVSLLRGFQATIPSSERGKNRRRQVRNVAVPHMGLKQLGMRARGMLDNDHDHEPDEELGSKSEDDVVLVGRTRRSKGKLKPKRRGRESLSATVALGRDELLLQTKEIMVDKENIHVRRTLLNSEIEEITHKIAALDAVRERLEQELLHLHEDELELDDEMDGVRERLSYEKARHPLKGAAAQAAQNLPSGSRRRKGPAFLPSEHDELPSGVAFMTLEGHSAPVTALDFSEPYGLLVTAAQDDSTRLWDLCSGEEIGRLRGHSGAVKCTQVEEHMCLTGGVDSTVRVWDLRLVDEEAVEGGDGDETLDEFGMRASTSSNSVGVGIDDSMSEENGCTRVLRGHSRAITALYFEDNCLVTGASDKTLRQWDLTTGQCVVSMDILWAMSHQSTPQPSWMGNSSAPFAYRSQDTGDVYEDFVGSVQFWGYGLVSGSGDGAVRMWDMRTGQSHRSLSGHTAPITSLQFDELNIISGSLDKTVRIWDLRTGGVLETLQYDHPVTSLQFDTRKILTCAGEKGASMYNRTTQQHSTLLTNGHTMPAVKLRYMDRYLVSGGKDSIVKVWAL
ncbi:WD40 repeat-like protein [Exidia glandulosa HHB12029]|uniref:WD40 repeat-like protein n=1 Tax=Exidia glandulosa HHB12029 TaxID=1314781 RepID=A0A165C3V3_EXIGL|nr:WD40 repeat-like protein [Exidia glandulosa HHB12029]